MAGVPPFPIPQGKPGHWEKVAGPEVSDGDVKQWPKKPLYRPVPETHYLISLATAWIKSQNLEQPRVNYYLEKLPSGYALFETERAAGDGQSYKRLFGHPTGRYYDSAKRFEVHFIWLMNRMNGDCGCVLCSGKKTPVVRRSDTSRLDPRTLMRPEERTQSTDGPRLRKEDSSVRSKSATSLASDREKRQPKPAEAVVPVDEEGTEDVYKKQIQELYKFRHREVDDEIIEKYSFDWKAERRSLPPYLSQLSVQHSFIPRVGELVLWCPSFPDELDITFNPETGFCQFYSFEQGRFLGFPNWHGGVVAAAPAPSSIALDGPVDFADLLSNPPKKCAYNTSGFRVETFPNTNNDNNNALSKQYKYVPLRQIRPLSHWQTLLRGIPERKLDPTVKYALIPMTTVSLLEKFRFTGDWPNASIHCKGIYLGAELIVLGDAVRILPAVTPPVTQNESTQSSNPKKMCCTDVLVVSSIRLNLHDITPGHALPSSRTLSTTSSIMLIGRAYTLDPHRDYRVPADLGSNLPITQLTLPQALPLESVKSVFPTVGAEQYGPWFPMHAPHLKYEISFDRVLGRLQEADAIRLWTGTAQFHASPDPVASERPSLSYGLPAVLAGREYAAQTNERIPEVSAGQIAWFWADTRVQALAVETFNGYEVGEYDRIREGPNVRAWRATLRVLDGTASKQDIKETRLPQRKGPQKGAKLVDGRVVYPGHGGSEGESGDGLAGRKRKRERTASVLGSIAGSQMRTAGLAQESDEGFDDDDDDDDDEDIDEESSGGKDPGRASANASGIDSGVDGPADDGAGQRRVQLARKHAWRRAMPSRGALRSKMQIMTSVEMDSNEEDDGGDDDDDGGDDDDDDDDDDDEYKGEDHDYEAVQDIVEGRIPLARGGTEETEGGDYNPLGDSLHSTT